MCQTGRLFHCLRCHKQVIICRHCDHGQIYCSSQCSGIARQASTRAAKARYQQTQQGKQNHAQRQRRYRANQTQISKNVTDHSSPDKTVHDVISPSSIDEINSPTESTPHEFYCHFCHKPVSNFLRNRFLIPTERYHSQSAVKITG